VNLIEFNKQYWEFYRALEDDFMKISRYVAFEPSNNECHSNEFLKQYQSICSEIDVICKLYCEIINPDIQCKNILSYAHVILGDNSEIVSSEVTCNNFILYPWAEWKCDHNDFRNGANPNNISPPWWKYYNSVKHNRLGYYNTNSQYYCQANLTNTLNSLSALFVLELNIYKKLADMESNSITTPSNMSMIFKYKDWESHIMHVGNGFTISY
jgi:hypothetical protein